MIVFFFYHLLKCEPRSARELAQWIGCLLALHASIPPSQIQSPEFHMFLRALLGMLLESRARRARAPLDMTPPNPPTKSNKRRVREEYTIHFQMQRCKAKYLSTTMSHSLKKIQLLEIKFFD